MSLQDSTFNTSHVLDNEIIKANDFEYAFEKIAENVSKATQMMLESNQDFVINGKVLPSGGMDVEISPIYGVCKATGIPFGRTESAAMEYSFEETTSGRVDILEVKGAWETFDNQQRAFNDPDTNVQTYQYVDTKKLMRPVYQIKQGVEGSSVAPSVDAGWVKLAEVVIPANATEITEENIKNITSDIAGLANSEWTNDTTATYNIGYISDVNARFRVQHKADGTHADKSINTDSLNIGVGAKQVNGNVLPLGGSVSVPSQTISSVDSIVTVFTKLATVITSLYNYYKLYGDYGFKGEVSLSALADENNVLTKPLKFYAAGDGTATVKIDNSTILSIDANGKLTTNGYTATNANHVITKAVSDAIRQDLTALTNRVTNVETRINGLDVSANNVISNKFAPDNTAIYVATTENITLQGSQTVDGITPAQGVNVLVKDQTDATENGVYVVSSNSVWFRLSTLATPNSLVEKIFLVNNGNTNAGKMFYSPQDNFLDGSEFGTDDIIFSEYNGTPKPIANKVIVRDSCGRAQVAAPATSCDIARKKEIDDLYGNVVGTALGTAAVGTATTFARSDHVHPNTDIFTGVKGGNGSQYYGLRINGQDGYGDIASDYAYFRTPFGGLIPYDRCCSCVGTCTWPFKAMFAQTFTGCLCGNASTATNATNATCASKNANGVNFGNAAVCDVFTRNTVGSVCWDVAACRTKLPTLEALAYWDGSHQADGSSNLTYFKHGQFGTAAACAATAFRSCTWNPDMLLDYRTQNIPICVTFQAPYPTNAYVDYIAVSLSKCESGKSIIGFMNKADICVGYAARATCASKDGSGCAFGTAARYACECFRPSSWLPYTSCLFGCAFATRSPIGNWTVTANTGSKSCDVWKAICWAVGQFFSHMAVSGYAYCNSNCSYPINRLYKNSNSEYRGYADTSSTSNIQCYCSTCTATVLSAVIQGIEL